jgi:hypothetical protein
MQPGAGSRQLDLQWSSSHSRDRYDGTNVPLYCPQGPRRKFRLLLRCPRQSRRAFAACRGTIALGRSLSSVVMGGSQCARYCKRSFAYSYIFRDKLARRPLTQCPQGVDSHHPPSLIICGPGTAMYAQKRCLFTVCNPASFHVSLLSTAEEHQLMSNIMPLYSYLRLSSQRRRPRAFRSRHEAGRERRTPYRGCSSRALSESSVSFTTRTRRAGRGCWQRRQV